MMEDRELLKEVARCVALHVPEKTFISYCLCCLRTEEERNSMIEYLKQHEGLSKTDIDIKITQVTRKRYSAQYGIR